MEARVDKRTPNEKRLCQDLYIASVLLFCVAFSIWLPQQIASKKQQAALAKRHQEWLASLTIELNEDAALIPVTIAGQTRQVRINKVEDFAYETAERVAVFKLSDRRFNPRVLAIQVRKNGDEYLPNLRQDISTGYKSYSALAVEWSTECSAEPVSFLSE